MNPVIEGVGIDGDETGNGHLALVSDSGFVGLRGMRSFVCNVLGAILYAVRY